MMEIGKLIILLTLLTAFVESMIVIMERANVTTMNHKYIVSGGVNIRRHGRNSPYYLNIYGVNVKPLDNTLMVSALFSQFLHNEYRRSFIEFHCRFCELINDEPFIGGMLKNGGLVCPLLPGEHYFMNLTVPTTDFKYVFPFEKGRVDFTLSVTATKEVVLQVFVEASFKQVKNLPAYKGKQKPNP
ncbi:uncharacterized protein LOC142987837 [Anticarsia gemmatalis]|uniref:uncharacterized protein LOC142987837 n=1 Tax=Anticarsia gemmatalis TaxID=129554 RepID=UPI003F768275